MKSDPANSKARAVLEKLIKPIEEARTLCCEGKWILPPIDGKAMPERRQKWYLYSDGGTRRLRVETSATVRGMSITTTMIKNEEGLWQILADQACEVSKVFAHDQLFGVFPIFRLIACLEHPYEMHLTEENQGGAECFVVTGTLADPPAAAGPEAAKEFTYAFGKTDSRLHSLREQSFANRPFGLALDKFELNPALDPALFGLLDRPRIIVSSFDQYLELRTQETTKLLREG